MMDMDFSRKLPVDMQDFEYLRKNGFLYVDKTAYAYRMANLGKAYFLGRPRRFGKSLFISMLKYYFQGRKELFEGLVLEKLEKEWTVHPVLHFDFVGSKYDSAEALEHAIGNRLAEYELQWGGTPDERDLGARFNALIKSAYSISGNTGVVTLFDEYDKPLLEAPDLKIQDEMRAVLKPFYGVLKGADQYLKFSLLTGVTKFSKVSIFSDLNNLDDISLWKDYAGICGISETEMKRDLMPDIEALAIETNKSIDETLAELKQRYDGYHFSEDFTEGIYNPFSLLNTLKKRKLTYYWFRTGTPTFLMKMFREAQLDINEIVKGELSITASEIDDYRTENRDPRPLLYQSGYLTITGYDADCDEYSLGFPNDEVKYGFLRELLPCYAPLISSKKLSVTDFVKDLRINDLQSFMTRLKAFFSSITFDLANKTEQDHQTALHILILCMGQYVKAEDHSAAGSADIVIETFDSVYIFELKLDSNGTAEDALAQIEKIGYANKYLASGKQIVKVGVEFDKEQRTIKRWLQE